MILGVWGGGGYNFPPLFFSGCFFCSRISGGEEGVGGEGYDSLG